MGEHKKKEQQIQIEADKQTAQGMYSNYATVGHSAEEFTLDFAYVLPKSGEPTVATLRARIVISPAHMKRLFSALGINIGRYEKRFGEIKEAAPTAVGETTLVQ